MTNKTVSYTEDQVSKMVADYVAADTDEARDEALQSIAEEFGKSVASVRSKLVREGVYVKKARTTKNGGEIVSKADLVAKIEDAIGVEPGGFDSLEKATKVVLTKILKAVS